MCIGGLIPESWCKTETVTMPLNDHPITFLYLGGSGVLIAGGQLLIISGLMHYFLSIQTILGVIGIGIGLWMRNRGVNIAKDPELTNSVTLKFNYMTVIILMVSVLISADMMITNSYVYVLVFAPLLHTLWLYLKVCKKEKTRVREIMNAQ